jgi:MFS family permease
VLGSPTFWFLALAFLIQAFAHAGMSLHAIPMLIEWGYTPSVAAGVMGLIGVMMIAGRLVLLPLCTRLSMRGVTSFIFVAQTAGLVAPAVVAGPAGLVVFVVCFGISAGMAALVRASIVADLWGRAHYGVIAGALSVSSTVARAIAPLAIGLAYVAGAGYRPILLGLALLSVLAVLSAARALGVAAARPAAMEHVRA